MSFFSRTASLLLSATFGLLSSVHATTLAEDFPSTSYTNGQLDTQGTATGGWSTAWGVGGATTGRIVETTATNLTYSGGGYNITQTGTGSVYGNFGDANNDTNTFRGVNRGISTPMTGTIWFSILLSDTDSSAHTGVSFNSDVAGGNGIDYDATPFRVDVTNSGAAVYFGSTTTPASSNTTAYATGTTHLLVGSLTVGAGTDSLSVWVDPTDLSNIGAATLTATGDVGSSLSRFGAFSYGLGDRLTPTGNSHGMFDAIRISDGSGDSNAAFTAVTGVTPAPEPGRVSLLGLCLAGLILRRRRTPIPQP